MNDCFSVSRFLAITLAVAQLACASVTRGQQAVITVDPGSTFQQIEGFGASGAWWAQIVGGWETSKRREIVDMLYSPQGMGLSIYRYNIGAGSSREIRDPWRRTETFEVSRGEYDWSRDSNAMRVLSEICGHGVENVVLFANSPPVRMTHSGNAFSSKDGQKSNLRREMYEQFADYLGDITEKFVASGIPVKTLSPINEPQWEWNEPSQEGCHYEPREVTVLTKLVLRALQQRKLKVRVEAPESGHWEQVGSGKKERQYLDALLADPYVFRRLDGYALHSYWSDTKRKRSFARYFFGRYPSKKLFMTEWCEMEKGRDVGMDSALKLASEMIEDLRFGVSSWQYWIAVSKYDYRDGLIYVSRRGEEITPTKRLWTMGNFSRFIRPGAVRCYTETDSKLKVLAVVDPDTRKTVLVVLNPTKRKVATQIEPKRVRFTKRYETSADRDLKEVTLGQDASKVIFPAESVTTLVQSREVAKR